MGLALTPGSGVRFMGTTTLHDIFGLIKFLTIFGESRFAAKKSFIIRKLHVSDYI